LKEGKQETHPLTDLELIKALANAYRDISEKHYLLFACAIAFGFPVSQLVHFSKDRLIMELALGDRDSVLPELFSKNDLINTVTSITKDKELNEPVFTAIDRQGNEKVISRSRTYKWLTQGLAKVKGVEQISASTLEKTYEYYKFEKRIEQKSPDLYT
jgi:hypothetical protein